MRVRAEHAKFAFQLAATVAKLRRTFFAVIRTRSGTVVGTLQRKTAPMLSKNGLASSSVPTHVDAALIVENMLARNPVTNKTLLRHIAPDHQMLSLIVLAGRPV
jgi:hypothetical protein